MHDADDMELLRDYDRQGSEAAFAELVQRHVSLVYSAALRHVAIAAHAEEITQAVFIILARKAASLRPDTILEGWLYETTRLTALSFLRGERRRQFREQEAYMQSTLNESDAISIWNQMSPLLDEAMSRLGKKDRDAVILRFFKEKNLGEVAAALKVTEAAAQSRVHRAVEKLRRFFIKRGIILTAAVLTAAISANSIQAAPVALAKSVATIAIVKGAAASVSTLTLIKGTLKIMAWTKAKTAIGIGVAAILAVGTTTTFVIHFKPQTDFPRTSWMFAGYGDPKSAFMSYLWASCQPDQSMFMASLTPAEKLNEENLIKMNTKIPQPHSEAETIADEVKRANDAWQNGGYRIIDQQTASDDQVLLHVEAQQPKQTMEVYVKMKKMENEWRFDGIKNRKILAHTP